MAPGKQKLYPPRYPPILNGAITLSNGIICNRTSGDKLLVVRRNLLVVLPPVSQNRYLSSNLSAVFDVGLSEMITLLRPPYCLRLLMTLYSWKQRTIHYEQLTKQHRCQRHSFLKQFPLIPRRYSHKTSYFHWNQGTGFFNFFNGNKQGNERIIINSPEQMYD